MPEGVPRFREKRYVVWPLFHCVDSAGGTCLREFLFFSRREYVVWPLFHCVDSAGGRCLREFLFFSRRAYVSLYAIDWPFFPLAKQRPFAVLQAEGLWLQIILPHGLRSEHEVHLPVVKSPLRRLVQDRPEAWPSLGETQCCDAIPPVPLHRSVDGHFLPPPVSLRTSSLQQYPPAPVVAGLDGPAHLVDCFRAKHAAGL